MICNWPDPYPDKLFYSICARFSERVQYPHRRSVVEELFVQDVSLIDLHTTSYARPDISLLRMMDNRQKGGNNDL